MVSGDIEFAQGIGQFEFKLRELHRSRCGRQSAATTTSLLKREIGALVEDYQRADANGKAFLVYTASFLVEGTEKQDPRSPSKK